MSFKGLYNIPSYVDFGSTFAQGLLDAWEAQTLDLAETLILLPNRRACRTLQTTFLRLRDGQALILPRMVPMGDLSDEDALGEAIAGGIGSDALPDSDLDLKPAWPSLLRDALLSRLVSGIDPDMSQDHAMALSQELSRLMDQIETEGLRAASLAGLNEKAELADHWSKSLKFLEILYKVWPGFEDLRGYISPTRRRRESVEAQIKAWGLNPPKGPVIAAGSTASIPSTRALLAAVLKLDKGAVVLPGLDDNLSDAIWEQIGEEVTHPQFGFSELLAACKAKTENVSLWPAVQVNELQARTKLLSRALLPVEATADEVEGWRAGARDLSAIQIQQAFEHVSLYEVENDDVEAQTIALALKEGLDRPEFVSALVTPDRGLAQRVTGHLSRWGLAPDDSAGLRLDEAPAFRFARIVLDFVESQAEHYSLLALLHHPLASLGLEQSVRQRGRTFIDLHVLRNASSGNGFGPLEKWLEKSQEKSGAFEGHQVLEKLKVSTTHLRESASSKVAAMPASQWLLALVETMEDLAQPSEPEAPSKLWDNSGAEDVVRFFMTWAEALVHEDAAEDPISLSTFRSLLDRAAKGQVVRSPFVGHPRILILGGIEARLATVDRVILGGLNEGNWPAETQPGPWMSRPMRKAFGLPSVERRIGLAAHDFCQAFGKSEVILTRAFMVDGSATVASRFIRRLKAFLKIVKAEDVLRPCGLSFAKAATNLDSSSKIVPASRPRPKPAVSTRPQRFSVTEIERWKANPYEFYAKHVLRLRALNPLGGRLDAALRGTVIHQALDDANQAFPEFLPEDFNDQVYEFLRAGFIEEGLPDAQLALWQPRLRKAADWFAEHEAKVRLKGRRWAVHEDKGQFRFAVGGLPYTLTCRADRIDLDQEKRAFIVDYKSGTTPSGAAVQRGDSPQLTLEAALIKRDAFERVPGDCDVIGLEYWKVNGQGQGGTVIKIGPAKDSSMEEMVDQSWEGLLTLIETYQNPDRPFIARIVRHGDFIQLARQDEWEGERGDES